MDPTKINYYTPKEVAAHNTPDDIWVSFLEKVYDLTSLSATNKGSPLLKPIICAAGTDISHWFNTKTRDLRMYVDPETGCRAPHTPQGRFLHVPLPYPDSSWSTDLGRPWWKDLTLCVGSLTRKSQFINIVNTLTSQQHVVEVCSEETIDDILQRYLFYNAHAASYTWKYEQKPLIMNKTLSENHILDEDEDFYNLSIDDNIFRQTVHLYFNDDLTEA